MLQTAGLFTTDNYKNKETARQMLLVRVMISSPTTFHNKNVKKKIKTFPVNFLGEGDSIKT